MAKHEFGIMEAVPEKGRCYDEYEPQKYNCISVDDDYLEDIICEFRGADFYWHTTDVRGKGIAYTGVALIPPEAMSAFADVIKDRYGLEHLYTLAIKAQKESKWLIHFGL